MSASVDVLAVMEHFVHHGETSRDRINAERARAALAELIEAAREVQQSEDAVLHWDGDGARARLVEAKGRLRIALDRVKGK